MKVLLIGGCDRFTSFLIDRLVKEGSIVSIIAPTDFDKDSKPALHYTMHQNPSTHESTARLMKSISPDAVFYAGGVYLPELMENTIMRGEYAASLVSMLDYSRESCVSKFVYMSSDEVYDRKAKFPADEKASLKPESVIGMLCEQCENLCRSYSDVFGMQTVVMRFAPVLGFLSPGEINKSYLTQHTENLSRVVEKHSFVYFKDAAEAVARVILNGSSSVYNVGGNEPVSGQTLSLQLQNEYVPPVSPDQERAIDSSLIKKELEWSIHYDLSLGMQEMQEAFKANAVRIPKNQKHTKEKDESRGKFRESKVLWTLETILMFVIAAFLMTLVKQDYMFSQINFLVIYIVIVSLLHGMKQSILAIVLSCIFFIYISIPEGMTLLSTVLNVSNILIIAQYILIGVMVGYTVDKYRSTQATQTLDYEYLSREYSELKAINEENIMIKHEYEQRLVDYKDSLPTLFAMMSRLNASEVEEIYPAAVRTVKDALKAPGVGLYITGKGSFLRLVASAGNPGFGGKSVKLSNYPDIKDKIIRQEVFVNAGFMKDEPQMVAPIIYQKQVIALVAINDLPFEMLSLHQINMLRTISAIITIFIVRAQELDELKKEEKYIEGTNILKTSAFRELLKTRGRASIERLSHYALLKIEQKDDLHSVYKKVAECFRENDYIGLLEDGYIYVLLSNSTSQEAETVRNRVLRLGVGCSIRKEAI